MCTLFLEELVRGECIRLWAVVTERGTQDNSEAVKCGHWSVEELRITVRLYCVVIGQ